MPRYFRPRRAPLDGWDPYGGREPDRRRRWAPRRVLRIALPAAVGFSMLGHDLVRLFEPREASRTERAGPPVAPEPVRPVPPDTRTALPRHAVAIGSPASWFGSDDYPVAALREHVQGTVRFRYTVDPDGRVRRCVPYASSGSLLLDETACGIYTLRARFWPARDRLGRPVPETQVQKLRWQIPGG